MKNARGVIAGAAVVGLMGGFYQAAEAKLQHPTASNNGHGCKTVKECRKALVWWKKHSRDIATEKWDMAMPNLKDAAFIAARVYRVDPWAMLRVVRCEITEVWPSALGQREVSDQNPSSTARGPAQFLDTTWSSTPFAHWSRTNAYVSMLAMASIRVADGSYHQWSCGWAARD